MKQALHRAVRLVAITLSRRTPRAAVLALALGLPANRATATAVRAAGGLVTLEFRYIGTMILIR